MATPATPSAQPSVHSDHGPTSLRLAVLILWVQAAGLGILAVVEFYKIVTGTPENLTAAILLGAMIAGAGALAAKVGHALTFRSERARGLAVVLQLSALPVAWFMAGGEGNTLTRLGGGLIGVVCLTAIGLLLLPATTAALHAKPDTDE